MDKIEYETYMMRFHKDKFERAERAFEAFMAEKEAAGWRLIKAVRIPSMVSGYTSLLVYGHEGKYDSIIQDADGSAADTFSTEAEAMADFEKSAAFWTDFHRNIAEKFGNDIAFCDAMGIDYRQ